MITKTCSNEEHRNNNIFAMQGLHVHMFIILNYPISKVLINGKYTIGRKLCYIQSTI